jgi:hypothetical protein
MAPRLLFVMVLTVLLTLVGAIDTPAAAPEAPFATTSVVNPVTVVAAGTAPAGSFGVERVLCPAGMIAVGGGIDMDNVLTMQVTSSAPSFPGAQARLIQRPVGANPAPIGWQATALNNAGSSQGFKVAVICAPLAGASTVVAEATAAAGSFGVERVLCPAGESAVGGGIDMDNVLTMAVSSSAPSFPGTEARLIQRPVGANPAPIGWQATALNNAGSSQGFKVGVICAPLAGASTVVAEATATAGSFGVRRVLCPAGEGAIGGGIDMDNVLTMAVSSSAPSFPGTEARLIMRPAGTNPVPSGWQATALNHAGFTQGFKVGAICTEVEYKVFLPLVLD